MYKIIELVGSSEESWEKTAEAAVIKASKSLRDLRISEVVNLNIGKDKEYFNGWIEHISDEQYR